MTFKNIRYYYFSATRLIACFSLILYFSSAYGMLHAQSRPDASSITRTLRFVFLPGSGQTTQLYYFSNNTWHSLNLENHSFGQRMDYHGPAQFQLYPSIPTEENPSSPVVEANLADLGPECLLILIPKHNQHGYHIYPIKDGKENFPAQSVLFVNLTRNELAGAFGDSIGTVGPGEHDVISYKNEGSTKLQMRMAVRERKNDDWNLVYSSTTPARGSHRRWLVIYTAGQNPAHIFPDFVIE